jgi:hypothetical protein
MGLKVRIPNAFTLNRLGTPDGSIPFPFGVTSYERPNGVFDVILHPQSLVDLCDILEHFETFAVFDVSHSTYDTQPGVRVPIDELGAALGVELASEDLVDPQKILDILTKHAASHGSSLPPNIQVEGYVPLSKVAASQNVDCQSIDDNAIVMAGDDLAKFLADFSHYNFHIFDGPKDFTRDEIVANLSSYRKHDWSKSNPLLPRLWLSSFFLDSHDDCHLYLEAYDSSFLKQIFERALQIYAGTVLAEESGFEGEIAGIPGDLIETLWPVNSGLTIFRSETKAQALQLRIGVSETEFSFQERKRYPIAFFVEYDALAGGWRVSK